MMVETGTQLSLTATDPKKIRNCSTSTTTTMSTSNAAEIQVYKNKKVDNKIIPKQSPPSSSPSSSAKMKTVQRSDLGCIKKSPPQIKRTRSATTNVRERDDTNSIKLRKVKSDSAKAVDQTVVADSNVDLGINKQVKPISENAENILPPPHHIHLDLDLQEEEEEEEEEEKEIEIEVEKKSVEIKDIVISLQEEKAKKVEIEEKKLLPSNDRSPPHTVTPTVEKIAPAVNQEKLNPISDHHHGASSRLESLADLIMWRDVSRSAFVFGIGAFAIISSSYTNDLNISCISVLSYLGLVYLAVSFTLRSIINRGNVDMDSRDEEYVVGEEEAVWLIKLVLPYLNEFLSKLRSLFSGDPATTMKLAVLLFILARSGGSITIWKMTKLGFFGVFMVPKLCSSYSSHLVAYGTFWFRRFGDAWESCSQKKAVAFGIFSLVWNLSSVVARVWAIFVLFVAYKYYQQCRIKEEGLQEEEDVGQNSDSQYNGKRVQAPKSNTILYIKKTKESVIAS